MTSSTYADFQCIVYVQCYHADGSKWQRCSSGIDTNLVNVLLEDVATIVYLHVMLDKKSI